MSTDFWLNIAVQMRKHLNTLWFLPTIVEILIYKILHMVNVTYLDEFGYNTFLKRKIPLVFVRCSPHSPLLHAKFYANLLEWTIVEPLHE